MTLALLHVIRDYNIHLQWCLFYSRECKNNPHIKGVNLVSLMTGQYPDDIVLNSVVSVLNVNLKELCQ